MFFFKNSKEIQNSIYLQTFSAQEIDIKYLTYLRAKMFEKKPKKTQRNYEISDEIYTIEKFKFKKDLRKKYK